MTNSKIKKGLIVAIAILTIALLSVIGVTVQYRNKYGDPNAKVWDGIAVKAPKGQGTEDSPYIIKTPANLAYVATKMVFDEYQCFELVANIDMGGHEFTSIGSETNPFTGLFNGNLYTISNIGENKANYYSSAKKQAPSLFGVVRSGDFYNIKVKYAYDNVTGTDGYGGIARIVRGVATIKGCANLTENITFNDCESDLGYGGLVGYVTQQTTIDQSYSITNLTVNGKKASVGGLVGAINLNEENVSTISNSYYAGAIASESNDITLGNILGKEITETETPSTVNITNVISLNDVNSEDKISVEDLATALGEDWTIDETTGLPILNKVVQAEVSATTTSAAYLRKSWRDALDSYVAYGKITSITFTKTKPTTGTAVSVGATAVDGATAWSSSATCYDVTAYVNGTAVTFYSSATIYAPTSCSSLFTSCSSLTSLNLSNFDTSKVTDMSGMFSNCSKLTSIDVSNFNTSKVTNIGSMFKDCSKLTSLDLSNFNTSNVTDMGFMFYGCSSLTSLNVSTFDTSNVTRMSWMFDGCSSLTNLNVSNFDTSNVTNMIYMFYNCTSLTSLDLSSFDTSNVTDMGSMFSNCSKLTSLDLSNFNTSKVTDIGYMFKDCSKLTSLDLSSFDTSKVRSSINIANMLTGCTALNVIKTPKTTGSVAITLPATYYDEANTSSTYTEIPANKTSSMTLYKVGYVPAAYLRTGWKTALNSYVSYNKITSITFTKTMPTTGTAVSVGATAADGATAWSSSATCEDVTAYVNGTAVTFYSPVTIYAPTNCYQLFYACSSLTSLNVSNFNTSKVTSMMSMFDNCSSLTSIDLSNFDTSKVTTMLAMFQDCTSLTSIDLSNFDTSNVTNMSSMFCNCSKLTSIDLSSFDTSNVTRMNNMFYNCTSLTSLDLSNFDTSLVTSSTNIGDVLTGCTALNVIKTPKKTGSLAITLPATYYDEANISSTYTEIPANKTSSMTLYKVGYVPAAYLRTGWKTALNSKVSSGSITSITFTKTKPTTGTAVSVGATAANGSTAWSSSATCEDVTAYVNGTTVTFYSPVIYNK